MIAVFKFKDGIADIPLPGVTKGLAAVVIFFYHIKR